jgi:hypothetical protein
LTSIDAGTVGGVFLDARGGAGSKPPAWMSVGDCARLVMSVV